MSADFFYVRHWLNKTHLFFYWSRGQMPVLDNIIVAVNSLKIQRLLLLYMGSFCKLIYANALANNEFFFKKIWKIFLIDNNNVLFIYCRGFLKNVSPLIISVAYPDFSSTRIRLLKAKHRPKSSYPILSEDLFICLICNMAKFYSYTASTEKSSDWQIIL